MTITEQRVEAEALERCWRCGETVYVDRRVAWGYPQHQIYCKCGATTPNFFHAEEVVEWWNARACLKEALAPEVVGEPVASSEEWHQWPPKPVAVPTREDIARIIDPTLFDYCGEYEIAQSLNQKRALEKADAILALLTPPKR